MKKIYVILAATVAALMALSCEKTAELEVPSKESNLKTYKAIFPSDMRDSKVYLHEDGKTGWEVGDVITIHGKATDELKTITLDGVTNTISADKKTATFTVALDMTPDDYGVDGFFAAYPHSAFAEYESNRTRYFNCFNNTNTLLLSGVYDSVNDAFVFYHVTGAISFTVNGDSFGGFDEYMVVGKNDEIIGFDHFNTRVATDAFTLYHYSSSGAKKAIRNTVEDDGSTVNYVYFPVTETEDVADVAGSRAECVDFSEGFIIYFLKGGVITHMVSTSKDVRIERQGLLRLGDITSHVKTYSPPTKHDADHPAIAGATDLGGTSDGTANCYVVRADVDGNANKVFKFRAVKGNDADQEVGAINSVEVLWETYNDDNSVTAGTVISQADFDKQPANTYYEICFKMPSSLKAGNALIAAKDVYDNILWSWHIWVPATAISEGTYGISTPNMLDRNLGALKAATWGTDDIQTMGLLYQWGRKDPFLNKMNHSSGSNDYTNHAKTSGPSTMETKQMASIEESIQNPTVFAGQSADKVSWLAVDDVTMWGADKTIYDPCPPGYKVPAKTDCKMFTDNITDTSVYTGYAYDTATCQVAVGMTGNVTVFPTGYLYYNGRYDEPHNRVVVWSTTYADTYRATNLYFKLSDGSYSQYKRSLATGGSIRCVAE